MEQPTATHLTTHHLDTPPATHNTSTTTGMARTRRVGAPGSGRMIGHAHALFASRMHHRAAHVMGRPRCVSGCAAYICFCLDLCPALLSAAADS